MANFMPTTMEEPDALMDVDMDIEAAHTTTTTPTLTPADIIPVGEDVETVTTTLTTSTPTPGKRTSREPVRKRQKKALSASASTESLLAAAVGGGDDLAIATGSTPAPRRSQSPAVTRSSSARARSGTPRRSPRGKTPVNMHMLPPDPFVSGNNAHSPVGPPPPLPLPSHPHPPRISSKTLPGEIQALNKLATGTTTTAVPQMTKTQETTIKVEGIPYEELEGGEEDYRDFMPPVNLQPGSPTTVRNGTGTATATSRRAARAAAKQLDAAAAINKVKAGRISKFKEASMHDRVSARPPAELVGYLYAHRTATAASEAGASQSTNATSRGGGGARKKGDGKPSFLARKYTGDEVFTFGGFIHSVFQFRGLEYCKENLWGPSKQKFMDRIHMDLERFKQQREVNEIRAKAEALYKLRKQKEMKEMEAKKARAIEELRRRKQSQAEREERERARTRGRIAAGGRRTVGVGFKRKFGDMAESFGSGGESGGGDRVWDADERAAERQLVEEAGVGGEAEIATDVDEEEEEEGEIEGYGELIGPLEVGEEDLSLTDEDSDIGQEELAQVEELAAFMTGREVVVQQVPSRPGSVATGPSSLQASPSRRGRRGGVRGRGRLEVEEESMSLDQMVFSQECEVPQFAPVTEEEESESEVESELASRSARGGSPFMMRGAITKNITGTTTTTATAPSESGASYTSSAAGSTSGGGGGGGKKKKKSSIQSALKHHASRVFGGVAAVAKSSASASSASGQSVQSVQSAATGAVDKKLTKRELQKQQRLRKKVVELEGKLLDTWRELEAMGGLRVGPQPPQAQAQSVSPPAPQSLQSGGEGSVNGGSVNGGSVNGGSVNGSVNWSFHGSVNGSTSGMMGPPPVPVRRLAPA